MIDKKNKTQYIFHYLSLNKRIDPFFSMVDQHWKKALTKFVAGVIVFLGQFSCSKNILIPPLLEGYFVISHLY
jgi:hypothetical protein